MPCLPVKPWQMTRVSLSTHTLALADMARVVVVVAEVAMRRVAAATPVRAMDAMVSAFIGFDRELYYLCRCFQVVWLWPMSGRMIVCSHFLLDGQREHNDQICRRG